MEKTCPKCGKVFETEYPTKIYCDEKCAKAAYYATTKVFTIFPHAADAEPLFSFECANCGKTVHVYSMYDQRNRYCCGKCAAAYKRRKTAKALAKQRYSSNLGMSGGMSLGSLKRREARSVDKDEGVEVRICPTCGNHFDVMSPKQKYCSIECWYFRR